MPYTPSVTYLDDPPNTTTPILSADINKAFRAVSGTDFRLNGDAFQRIAVPSYFYPTWFNAANIPWYHTRPPTTAWERLQAAVPYAEICIISPTATGAGTSINTDYVTQVAWARAAGLTILGYIDTNYTAVSSATVQTNVDNYYTWYAVDGIFLDQTSANPTDIPYYTTLYNYIKAKIGRSMVVINPGTVTDEGYMPICDIVCNVETDPAGYRTRPITDWEVKYPAKKFWHIVYNVPDVATRDEMLQLSRNYRAGYIYFTNDILPNPYDTLPPDWFWKPLLESITDPYDYSANIYATAYGAVGNDSADDTTTLQNALNAVVAANVTNALGGTLHLAPNKNYKITSALTWPSNVTIDGHGSSIHQTTANANALVSTDGINLGLHDITIRGPVAGSPSGTGSGVVCQRSSRANVWKCNFRDVIVHSFGVDGINLSNPITSHFSCVEARTNAGHGFNIHGVSAGAAGTSCVFTGCYGNGNIKAGFHLDTMVYCSFDGCATDSCGMGYELVACQGITFNGCGAESHVNNNAIAAGYAGYSWKINGGFGICLTGCWTYDQPSIAVWITGNASTVIVAGFTENTPHAGSTYAVQNDAGCTTTTLSNISNTNPVHQLASVLLINDGGGLSVPGYGFFGGKLIVGSWLNLLAVATGSRPSASSAGAGATIYDTTLSKPIWSNGTVWKDSTGTTV